MSSDTDLDLDKPTWGAANIGRVANVLDENGEVDIRKSYYLCVKLVKAGVVKKVGRRLVGKPRRILQYLSGEQV